MKCVACTILERNLPADTAFLAGVAFAFQHNNDAIKRQVCEKHAASLVRGASATSSKVDDADRRVK